MFASQIRACLVCLCRRNQNLRKCHNERTLIRYASTANSQSQNQVFDKKQRINHLDTSSSSKDAHVYDYLRDHIAKEFCDRIDDLTLSSKQLILNLGSCSGLVSKNINPDKVDAFIQADISNKSLTRCRRINSMLPPKFPMHYIRCDEERIPLRANSVDLVMSCLDLHWVNDLVGCFNQVRDILGDNKPFMGVLFGGDTLFELRSSLQLAELERLSGFSSHVAPKTTGQDIARLLQMCGFKLITVDISETKVNYPSMFELIFDLQGMGENNKSLLASRHMHRDVLQAAASIYQVMYGDSDTEKGIPATFQSVHFIAWKNPAKATPLRND